MEAAPCGCVIAVLLVVPIAPSSQWPLHDRVEKVYTSYIEHSSIKGAVPLADGRTTYAKRTEWTRKNSRLAPSVFHQIQKRIGGEHLRKQNRKKDTVECNGGISIIITLSVLHPLCICKRSGTGPKGRPHPLHTS